MQTICEYIYDSDESRQWNILPSSQICMWEMAVHDDNWNTFLAKACKQVELQQKKKGVVNHWTKKVLLEKLAACLEGMAASAPGVCVVIHSEKQFS